MALDQGLAPRSTSFSPLAARSLKHPSGQTFGKIKQQIGPVCFGRLVALRGARWAPGALGTDPVEKHRMFHNKSAQEVHSKVHLWALCVSRVGRKG